VTATAEVNGVRLAYRTAGDPANPPMLLLHGLGDSGADWEPVLPALAADFHVHVLDLRGHGASDDPAEHSFELMRDDVIGWLDTLGIDRCVLVGHSMGAVVATLVAERAPHRITRLVLEDAVVPQPGDLDRPPLVEPGLPRVVNPIRAQLTAPDPEWWEQTAAIEAPALILSGTRSGIPYEMLAKTARRMPDARLVSVEAGHHIHRDNPAGFLRAVRDHLSGSG
jgi:pimeloyl-ACP methyl ester carboxylesterase